MDKKEKAIKKFSENVADELETTIQEIYEGPILAIPWKIKYKDRKQKVTLVYRLENALTGKVTKYLSQTVDVSKIVNRIITPEEVVCKIVNRI